MSVSDVSYAKGKSSLFSTCGVWLISMVVELVQARWRMVSEKYGGSCRVPVIGCFVCEIVVEFFSATSTSLLFDSTSSFFVVIFTSFFSATFFRRFFFRRRFFRRCRRRSFLVFIFSSLSTSSFFRRLRCRFIVIVFSSPFYRTRF